MGLVIWRGFNISVPDEWEILQFSKNFEIGSLLFADRYSFRFEFNWNRLSGKPYMEKIVEDYLLDLVNNKRIKNEKRITLYDWKGFEGIVDGILTSRFGKWFEKESCMIEGVFLWDLKRDLDTEENVLTSISTDDIFNKRRWKAFGIDLVTEKDAKLVLCDVKPAYCKMVFKSKKCEETFERFGLVNFWLKEDYGKWSKKRIPQGFTVKKTSEKKLNDHSVKYIFAEGYRKFRRLSYQSQTWLCPEDKRLYNLIITKKYSKSFEEDSFYQKILCCNKMEIKI